MNSNIASKKAWYGIGIVDGIHTNTAIVPKINVTRRGHDSWAGFKWGVTSVRGGHPINRYSKLSRMQNARY